MKKLIFVFTCLFLAISCLARIITVDDDEAADFNNIQAAINDSNNGDTIIVADGIYTGEGNRDIELSHGLPEGQTRAITVRSANGPENCIIDCNGTGIENYNSHRGFRFVSGEYANSVISGFTIINGYAPYEVHVPPLGVGEYLGGAIYCWRSSPTISNCIIKGNTAGYGGYGGGIVCFASNSTVSNCIFIGNQAYEGGGMSILFGSDPTIINCTFSGNVAYNVGGGIHNGNVIGSLENYPKLSNCILWGNSPDEIDVSYGTPVIIYSNVEGGWAGEGNIEVDPCSIEPGHWEDPCNTPTMPWDDIWFDGDYHLKSQAGRWNPNSQSWVKDAVTSPSIDAGDPNSDWTAELWPHGKQINMGAYGGTTQASMSLSDAGNIADLNNDGSVDYLDVKLFTDKWPYHKILLPEDLDRNGFIDFNDFALFGLQWSYPSAFEPGITYYQIEKCDPNSFRSLATEQAIETRFTVTVEGRYIHFVDMMVANCCTDKLELQMVVEENIIIIREIEYVSAPCFCICDYPVTATLGPFEPGVYTLEVYEDWGGFIGSTTVVIDPPP